MEINIVPSPVILANFLTGILPATPLAPPLLSLLSLLMASKPALSLVPLPLFITPLMVHANPLALPLSLLTSQET